MPGLLKIAVGVVLGLILGTISVAVSILYFSSFFAGWGGVISLAILPALGLVLARNRPKARIFVIALITTTLALMVLYSTGPITVGQNL